MAADTATVRSAMTMFDDLKAMHDKIAALPEPIAYIVLDHGWSPSLPRVDGHDARGKRYVRISPALLDSIRHVPPDDRPPPLYGIPIYRRESMAEGWPER